LSTGRNGPTQSRTAVARKSRTLHRARRNSGYRISPTAPRVLLGRDDSPRGPCCERVRSLQRGHAARGRIGWSEDRKPVQRHLVRSGRRIVHRKGAVRPTFTKKEHHSLRSGMGRRRGCPGTEEGVRENAKGTGEAPVLADGVEGKRGRDGVGRCLLEAGLACWRGRRNFS